MTDGAYITILAGSAEGHALAKRLPGAAALLPARLRTDPGGVAYRIAPDWGAEALVAAAQGPVVLATHPCDGGLRAELPAACAARGVALLHLCRPGWEATAQDRWHRPLRDEDVARIIPEGARVFVGLGRSVRALETALAGRYLVIRQLGGRGAAYGGQGHYLDGDAPFSVAQEIETLRAERIDWLLLRDAGGAGSWPKLAAARALGLPVALLPRPAPMAGVAVAESVAQALAWLQREGADP